ncbi:MAG: hypothetical protein AAFS10_27780, partial [Myxococcota bacterium]
MPIFRRPDGDQVPRHTLSPLRQMLPFIMPGRNGSVVYFEELIDVTSTLDWLETTNAGLAEPRCTLFHVFLGA